ncbi:MAG: four helix bundle protein [Chthoniobacterales bacterium]
MKIKDRPKFRFETLEIWQRAASSTTALFALAQKLDERRFYRFAEQLRPATLSITNNRAEGSGSDSPDDFANFLKFSRRSVYEVASMLSLLTKNGYLAEKDTNPLLEELEQQSKMLFAFRRALKKPRNS